MRFEGDLLIRKIRSKGGYGGIIFSAVTLDADKPIRYVVKASSHVARSPRLFKEHHTWRVTGEIETQKIKWKDGTEINEKVIIPELLSFIKSRNENLRSLLANSKEFMGISDVKAQKLVSFFGDELYQIARDENLERLDPILGKEVAQRLIKGLNEYEELAALQLLDELGVPPYVGDSVLKIWGKDAYSVVKKNPYLLIAFLADMKVLDEYSISRMGIAEDSEERLIGHVKNTLFNGFSSGNTCIPISDLRYRLKRSLEDADLAVKAIEIAIAKGEIELHDQLVQVKSMGIIESSVASIVRHLSCNKIELGASDVLVQLDRFEDRVGFSLTDEQKNAVAECCQNSLTLLTGGAGCGKTTVIEAICSVLEGLGQTDQILTMALSGKAAKRITEATGRDSMTIAGFMYNMDADQIKDNAVIIVDEASMVDILSLLKILKRIPPNGRLILTGDPEQLPPVGVGLGLHILVGRDDISNPHLSVVKRQKDESGIPSIANAIRLYATEPTDIDFSPYQGKSSGVSFIECEDSAIQRKCLEIYEELGGDGGDDSPLVLSAVKHQIGGVSNLNALIHDSHSKGEKLVFKNHDLDSFTHNLNGRPLRIGDSVMYTRNDYDKDLRNGSVGRILSQAENMTIADFEGNEVELTTDNLADLEHAYAMTVHKSQGSQFDRVIVVIKETRNLDRHLIYTALTRAKHQVVFVGNKNAFYKGLNRSNANQRLTLLSMHLSDTFLEQYRFIA